MSLEHYGWVDYFARQRDSGASDEPARVMRAAPRQLWLATAAGPVTARLPRNVGEVVVGDWVVIDPESHIVKARLTRRNELSRKRPGTDAEQQILAANFDVVFVVAGLDGDLSPRRLERYLIAIHESGASAVVVLNKSDLCDDAAGQVAALRAAGFECPTVVTCAETGRGLDELSAHLVPGQTTVFVGSSGVGKSSLINGLLAEHRQKTAPVREADGRGRHTTTHRELFLLPQGWLLIDLPGIREIQPWSPAKSVDSAFPEIIRHGDSCRFRDCSHGREPGCAVRLAVQRGEVTPERLESFLALREEQGTLEKMIDERAESQHRKSGQRSSPYFSPRGE